MPSWPWRRKAEKATRQDLVTRQPADLSGASTRNVNVDALMRAMNLSQGHQDLNGEGRPLPRPEEWVTAQFGPDWPLPPEPLDAPSADGQPEPRIWQYPFSWNIQLFDERQISWETLRQAAETSLMRTCIEVRKEELSSLDWVIRVNPVASEQMARASRKSKESVEEELRTKYEKEIAKATAFWQTPDRRNGYNFADWVSLVLEEQLVWDAIAIYPRRTYGGDLLDLLVIDGSTIKPLLDQQGGRPEPPAPAYQQILYGYPRGEYTPDTVDIDGETVVPAGLTATQLIYRRRVVRTRTPYGFSPTERALLDGLLYNRRFGWMVAEYTEGTQPAQFMKNTGDVDWSARQLLQYEKVFNDRYSGNTAERHRFALLPPGIEPAGVQQVPERYKADYDLHLIARVAMHYGITLPELGFTEKGGLGSAGYHEGQEAVQYRRSRLPDIRWFQRFLTEISCTQLNLPSELEFAFLGLEEEDEASSDAVVQNKVSSGRMTLNEARARDGLPAFNFNEADMPMLETARGVVFIQGASDQAPAGVMIEPASEKIDPNAPSASPGAAISPTQRRPITPAGRGTDGTAAKEVETFRSWVRKNGASSRRRFEFDVTYDEAASIDPDFIDQYLNLAFFKAPAAGGGAAPKASSGLDGSLISPSSPYIGHP